MKGASAILLNFVWTLWVLASATPSAWAQGAEANLDLARRLNAAFADIAEKVAPLVVVIDVSPKPGTQKKEGAEAEPRKNSPDDFWRYFHKRLEQQPEPPGGEGSGFIIRENGYILTSYHVVQDAGRIGVRLRDGRKFPATLRGADAQSDLAVVKIDTAGLPVAALADSAKVRVGEFAIAVGAPFELDFSVTFGHVSAKGRSNLILGSAGAAMDQEFIQTDASINPGNSGGPLFNLDGEVIGVNCLIRGMRTGIGFAVPSNLARQISDKLVAEGRFARPWLGVGIRALRDTAGDAIAKEVNDGVIVSSIQPDGPAAKSELKPGDIITAIEGKPVGTAQELRAEIRGKPIGQAVMLAVYRPGDGGEGKRMQVKVVLEEWVQTEPILAQAGVPGALANELGLTVHPLTRDMASRFGVELKPGVLVILVEDESVAARKGIQPGDIITAVNQEPVANLEQFRDALAKAEMKKGITLSLLSGDKRRTLVLKNSRD